MGLTSERGEHRKRIVIDAGPIFPKIDVTECYAAGGPDKPLGRSLSLVSGSAQSYLCISEDKTKILRALGATELVQDGVRRLGIAPKARRRKMDESGELGSGTSKICDKVVFTMSRIVVRMVVFRFV